jgi:hypothetical protein
MRGAPHNGLAWLMRRIKSRISALVFGLPGGRRDFPVQGESSPVPSDDRGGLHHLQTSAPTRPESRQQNP